MSNSRVDWSTPSTCPYCRYPAGKECDSCHSCGAPLELFSASTLDFILDNGKRCLSYLAQMTVCAALMGAGLYLCLKVSPFLLLFPLFFVLTQDKGS